MISVSVSEQYQQLLVVLQSVEYFVVQEFVMIAHCGVLPCMHLIAVLGT